MNSNTNTLIFRKRQNGMIEQEVKGFTLIELLVVVAIVGILAAVGIPQYNQYRDRAKYANVVADIRNVGSALEAYRTESNSYPPDAVPGVVPPELSSLVDSGLFTNETPLGGLYDYNAQPVWSNVSMGILGVGAPGVDVWQKIDGLGDDGDLSTGKIQTVGGLTVYIFSENTL